MGENNEMIFPRWLARIRAGIKRFKASVNSSRSRPRSRNSCAGPHRLANAGGPAVLRPPEWGASVIWCAVRIAFKASSADPLPADHDEVGMNGRQAAGKAPVLDDVLGLAIQSLPQQDPANCIAGVRFFVCQYNPHVGHLNKCSEVFCMSLFLSRRFPQASSRVNLSLWR